MFAEYRTKPSSPKIVLIAILGSLVAYQGFIRVPSRRYELVLARLNKPRMQRSLSMADKVDRMHRKRLDRWTLTSRCLLAESYGETGKGKDESLYECENFDVPSGSLNP